MHIFEEFERKMTLLFQKINGKQIIIWGWGFSGKFLDIYLRLHNREAACIIDDGQNTKKGGETGIRSHHILNYYNPKTTVILVSIWKDSKNVETIAKKYGFCENSILFVRKYIYGVEEAQRELDYFDWIDFKYDMGIVKDKSREEQKYIKQGRGEFHNYWASRGIGIEAVMKTFAFKETDAIFDFGCGKGGKFLIFQRAGLKQMGGIEYDSELYDCARQNVERAGIQCQIVCGDAKDYTDIDRYNYFYMFDPFEGECFKKCITNIQDSFIRYKRKIILIYDGPVCHDLVVEDNMFQLAFQLENPFCVTHMSNIYVLE